MSVRGAAPVTVVAVEPGSLADLAQVREGDLVVGLGDSDVKWASHEQVGTFVLVLQKVPSEFYPKVCNHGEGPY